MSGRAELEQRWQLADLREFLLRSLHDAEAEHDAGDLSEADYRVLVERDQTRLSLVEHELAALRDAPAPAPEPSMPTGADRATRRRVGRWAAIAASVAAIVVGAVILVVHLTSSQLPGQTFDGTVTLNAAQQVQRQLSQADTLVQENHPVQALRLYRQILAAHPRQPEALAEAGWIEWQAGQEASDTSLMNNGATSVSRAVALDPALAGAHLFLGIIDLRQQHDAPAAVAQFKLVLASHPANSLVVSAAPFLQEAYAQADVTLPSDVAQIIRANS